MQDRDAHLAALEADIERHRRADERAFDARIALAECGALGHLPPAPDSDTVEILAWGSSVPLRSGPYCRRCGASLNDPQEAP